MNPRSTGNYESLCERAHALFEAGRSTDALRLIEQAAMMEPDAAAPHELMSAALFGLGKYRPALTAAREAIKRDPGSVIGHTAHAASLVAMKKRRAALKAALQAAALAPEVPEVLSTLAYCYLFNWKKRQAREVANRLLELAPELPVAHTTIGRVAAAERRWKQAEAHFRDTLALDPTDADAMNCLAVTVQRQRRQVEAIQLFDEAARLDPEAALARKNLFNGVFRFVAAGLVGSAVSLLLLPAVRAIFHYESTEFMRGFDVGFLRQGILWMTVAAVIGIRRMQQVPPRVRRFCVMELERWWYTRRLHVVALVTLLTGCLGVTLSAALNLGVGRGGAGLPLWGAALYGLAVVVTFVLLLGLLRREDR